MTETILNTLLRTIFAYFLLLLLSRFMGRKLISQLTFFDFIVGITIGSVTANLAIGRNSTTASTVTVLLTLTALTILIGYVQIKSFLLRKWMNSEPVIVIENGKINYPNMKKVRFSINNLTMLLRQKNVFHIGDVEFAVLETDGQLSVNLKSQKQPVTPSDLQISTMYKGLTKDLIMDGRVIQDNLQDAHLDLNWLKNELRKKNIERVEDVFYAGLDTSGNVYISEYNMDGDIEKEGKHGIE